MPIDLILGDRKIREQLTEWTPIRDLESSWQNELQAFEEMRKTFLLYA